MVTVAKTIDAPIKILFPTDFLTNGIFGTQHSILGLGDIVIPGIMIALLARFDSQLNRGKHTYKMVKIYDKNSIARNLMYQRLFDPLYGFIQKY